MLSLYMSDGSHPRNSVVTVMEVVRSLLFVDKLPGTIGSRLNTAGIVSGLISSLVMVEKYAAVTTLAGVFALPLSLLLAYELYAVMTKPAPLPSRKTN